MTEEEILNLVLQTEKTRRSVLKGGVDPAVSIALGKEPAKTEIPEYYPGYRDMVEQYRHIEYHADSSIFPDDLFSKRSPNIDAAAEVYIRENYKNNTQTVFLDYVNQLNRVFHDSNWSISFDSTNDEDSIKNYLQYGIIEFNSIKNFMQSICCPVKVMDSNGLIAVKPMSFAFKFDADGEQAISEDGSFIVDDTVRLEPQPVYYRIDQIVSDKFGSHYLILLDEKSKVKYGGKDMAMGNIYEFYDTENIYRITQVGKYNEYTFEIMLYLNHAWGYVPAFKLKGVAKIKRGIISYVSPFYYATHALDAALLNASNLQASTDNCAYPYRIMLGDECEYEYRDSQGKASVCHEGYVFDEEKGSNIICPSCNGLRLKSKLSPVGVLLIKPSSSTSSGDKITASDAMTFVAPDPAILVFLREQIQYDLKRAKEVLHLRTKEAQTTGPVTDSPTATGEVLDQKAQDAFIKPQSDQIFELMGNICEAIEWQRYGREASFSITAPITFDFMDQQDYLNDIAAKKAAGLPPAVINTSIKKFVDGNYWNDSTKSKTMDLIIMADRILSMTADETAFQLAKNLIAPWEMILHDSASYFISDLLLENPSFLDQEIEDQVTQLSDKAKEKAAELKPVETGNAIDLIVP